MLKFGVFNLFIFFLIYWYHYYYYYYYSVEMIIVSGWLPTMAVFDQNSKRYYFHDQLPIALKNNIQKTSMRLILLQLTAFKNKT